MQAQTRLEVINCINITKTYIAIFTIFYYD